MPAPATDMDSLPNGGVESSAESPAPEADAVSSPVAAAATKGRGLRRWRRIRREQQRGSYDAAADASGGGGRGGAGDGDAAQLQKRRLPLPADAAPKGRHEAALVEEEESSTASVESRFVPPARLDPGLGLLVTPAGFSVGAGGADSDNSEDRSSRFSTAASAAPVFPSLLLRERDRPRHRAAGASLHGKNPRGARSRADKARFYAAAAAVSTEAENSRSSVESDLHSSNAMNGRRLSVGTAGNGVHKVLSDLCDHGDEGQPSEGARSTAGGYYQENGSSVEGNLVQRSADSGDGVEDTVDEGSVGKAPNGGMHSGDEPYAQSILLLQITQDALENEIQKFAAIGKDPSDDFDVHGDDWSGLVHLEEPIEEASEMIKHLESRLEEASTVIKEKDSRILGTLSWMQPWKTAIDGANLLLSHSELDRLFQEKMEAEIQSIILTRAYHTWATLADDQMALYEAQKSLCQDYKQLGLKLRHTENRAMMLEEMAEKLVVQCRELSRSSEVLQLQSKASRVSLFCFVQFILLCIAIGIYLMQLVPSSTEVVPT
ncbi:hypothetical protein ACP70R_016211 [Stipagrostis hirtigluma subsp. patula]